jgi:hypothetical protein
LFFVLITNFLFSGHLCLCGHLWQLDNLLEYFKSI